MPTVPDTRHVNTTLRAADYGLYAMAVFVWGTSWLAMKLQIGVVTPEVSVFWRIALSSMMMLVWVAVTKRPMRFAPADHLRFAGMGALMFSTNFVLFYHGAQWLPSGLLSVVFSMTSIVNMALSALFFRQSVSRRVLFAGALGVTGVAAMFWPQVVGTQFDANAAVGLLFCLAGTLSFCCGNMLSYSTQRRGLPVISANAWGMIYATMLLGVFSALSGKAFVLEWTPAYLGALAWLAAFSTVIAFATYLTLLGRIGSARAGYATVLFPVVALAISTIVEGYQWTPVSLAGLICVLAGNLVALTRSRAYPAPSSTPANGKVP